MTEPLSKAKIARWKKKIDAMSQEDMARLWRFSEAGHPIFIAGSELFAYFTEKFKGFTPEISKRIGLYNKRGDS
jgi:hypothetical protein